MRRVLFGWELGAGLGHIRRILVVAKALQGHGWQTYLAIRDIHALPMDALATGGAVLQAPAIKLQVEAGEPFRAVTFADTMGMSGYASEAVLTSGVGAWDALLDLIQPALVIADFSPVLHLAASGRAPVVAMGDGFCVPPADQNHFPVLRPGDTPHFADLGRLLENARRVQRHRGLPEPETLASIMAGAGQFVCVAPEVDVYRAHRSRAASGSFEGLPLPLGPPAGSSPSLFFYLPAAYPYTRVALEAIAMAGISAEGYIHPEPPGLRASLERRGITLHSQPQPMAEALARNGAILHHGGVGTTEQALALGRPQLVVPSNLERSLNARAVEELGVGIAVRQRHRTAKDLTSAIRHVITDPQLRERAVSVARSIERRPSLDRMLSLCETVARSTSPTSQPSLME